MNTVWPWFSPVCATSAIKPKESRMNILIVGSGGREHALAWKAAQNPEVETVYVAPGNAGTASDHKLQNLPIDVLDFAALANFAAQNRVALTIIGPEAPLVAGI